MVARLRGLAGGSVLVDRRWICVAERRAGAAVLVDGALDRAATAPGRNTVAILNAAASRQYMQGSSPIQVQVRSGMVAADLLLDRYPRSSRVEYRGSVVRGCVVIGLTRVMTVDIPVPMIRLSCRYVR